MQAWISRHPLFMAFTAFFVLSATLVSLRWPAMWAAMTTIWVSLHNPAGDDRLTAASVHAAALSILFAALWVLTSDALNALTPLEEDAYEEANKIRNLKFPIFYDLRGPNAYNTATLKDRQHLAYLLTKLTWMEISPSMSREPAARGWEALRIMAALSQAPPFTPPFPTNLAMIGEWAHETGELMHSLETVWKMRSQELNDIVESYLNAASVIRGREIKERMDMHRKQMETLNPEIDKELADLLKPWLTESLRMEMLQQDNFREFVKLFRSIYRSL